MNVSGDIIQGLHVLVFEEDVWCVVCLSRRTGARAGAGAGGREGGREVFIDEYRLRDF